MPRRLPTPLFDSRIGGNSLGDLPEWDLRDLYSSPEAPEIDRDLTDVQAAGAAFEAAYKGKLAAQDAAGMLAAIRG